MPDATGDHDEDRPNRSHPDDFGRAFGRAIFAAIPECQLDNSTHTHQVIGLPGMGMPVGHSTRAQFDPVYLPNRNVDPGPIDPEYFSHETTSCDHVS